MKRALALLALSGCLPAPALAHPHVFVEHAIVVLVGAGGVEGVQLAYTFDEFFTSMVMQSYDTDRDGTISRSEMRVIEEKHFGNVRQFDYFVILQAGGRRLPVTVRDFHVQLPRNQVTYVFTVPVSGLDPTRGALEIVVDDPTFYTAFVPRERKPVEVKASPHYRVDCAPVRDRSGATPDSVR
jgi:ABC-type uncharacterized transport system substrate-binding protein